MSQHWPLEEIIKAAVNPSQTSIDFCDNILQGALYGQYALEISGAPYQTVPKVYPSHTLENALIASRGLLAVGCTLRLSGPNGLNLDNNAIENLLNRMLDSQ